MEENVLSEFLRLYNEWIHSKFVQLHEGRVIETENLDTERLELTRNIHIAWNTLKGANENYTIYRGLLEQIKKKYFADLIESIPTTYGAIARCLQEDDSD